MTHFASHPNRPPRLRVGVLLSGGGRTLANFLRLRQQGELNADFVVVGASRDDAGGLAIARSAGLPTFVAQRRLLLDADFHGVLAHMLRSFQADLVCLAGFLSLWRIPQDFMGRVINIHPALLPKFGGIGFYGHHVHQAVLDAGETESGCTVHFADDAYDHGPIIRQRVVPVMPGETADSLAARVFEAEKILYPEVIRQLAEGRIRWAGQTAPLR